MQQEIFDNPNLNKTQTKYLAVFESAYEQLNPEQKAAVDILDGPVMVIAGPGTGKTQILAVRIGKILKDTDTSPHNLLCLTFTDAATLAMRKRLVKTIGPIAHQIHIYTFHAFCNNIIQENLGVFGSYRQLDLLNDIEEIEVYKEILDQLPSDHILKNLKGNDQFEMKRLKNLFQFMKKENLNPDQIENKVDDYLKRKKLDSHDHKLFYQRKYKEYNKGDSKPGAWDDLQYKMNQLKEASSLYDTYQSIMDRKARYDYQDMILWVLKEFHQNELLLQKYQERYQYVLVDEYQDTNGAQNALLEILISYWEDAPNVFVVGDDDQAIYKFQGANMDNIKSFKEKYKPKTVVLKRNYRSSQVILNSAKRLIEYNSERLVHEKSYGIDKDLIAEGVNKNINSKPKIIAFQNESKEDAYIADLLSEAHSQREDLSKTAILYRQHSQVKTLVSVLEKRNVPLNIKRSVNILHNPLIRALLTIMKYISIEHKRPNMAEDKLGELMYYSFFSISSNDVARISLANRKNSKNDPSIEEGEDSFKMREIISDRGELEKIGVNDVEKVLTLSNLLDGWISAISNTTLQVLFEKIINEGLILNTVLTHGHKSWLLQVLNTFFDFIKAETTKKPNLSLDDFLSVIDIMDENDLPLSVNKVIYAENGVHFITAHSAKGLEFERVIIKGASKNIWDKSTSTRYQYSYPDNLNEDIETNDQDERRLFFVAVTRAEKSLMITYAEKKDEGKVLGASQFIDEIIGTDNEAIEQNVDEVQITLYLSDSLTSRQKKVKLIDNDLIDKKLESFKMSVTGLNKYLRCPIAYYFEDILRIPTARNKYMGFGRAIHHALQFYFQGLNDKKEVNSDTLHFYFIESMKDHHSHFTKKEYTDMTAYGKSILSKYYDEYLKNDKPVDSYELEIKIDHADYDGIPIKGVLDRVAIKDQRATVTDYKTGNYSRYETKKKLNAPSENHPVGGDYWRQIVFYKLLSQSDTRLNWIMERGEIDFVEPDKRTGQFFKKGYQVSEDDIATVGVQIKETWDNIHNHQFSSGCNDDNCYWCSFVQNDFVFADDLVLDNEDSIQDT